METVSQIVNYTIILLGLLIFLPLAHFRTMRTFFKTSKTSKLFEVLIFTLFPLIVTVITALILPVYPIINATRSFITLLIITLNYKGSTLKKVAAVVSIMIFISFIDNLYIPATATHVRDNTFGATQPLLFDSWIAGLTLLTMHLLIFTLKPFGFIQKEKEPPQIVWITFVSASAFIYIVLLTTSILNLYTHFHYIISIPLFMVFILLLYLLDRLTITYEKNLASALHTQEKEHYQLQYQLMQESIESTRAAKHDLNLHLNSLHEQFKSSPSDAESYLKKLIADNKSITTFSNTGNLAFDAIINYKLGAINANDAILNIDIKVPAALEIESTDVTIILGNLLDNAISAIANIKNPFINLKIDYTKGRLLIACENSFDGVVHYKKEKIISRYDEKNRGIGMQNIRKAVERYNGEMTITHKDHQFNVEIMLYI